MDRHDHDYECEDEYEDEYEDEDIDVGISTLLRVEEKEMSIRLSLIEICFFFLKKKRVHWIPEGAMQDGGGRCMDCGLLACTVSFYLCN